MRVSTVHLICTRHEELGECNVERLVEMFSRIQPDVIFEELDADLFDQYYLDEKHHSLESDAVKRYRSDHQITQVPVDVLPWRDNHFVESYKHMLHRVESQISQDAFHFRNALDMSQQHAETYGFKFLNSDYNDNILNEIDRLRLSILEQMNDSDLKEVDRRMTDIYRQRELTMMRTIYDHAAAHPFKTGVFYVGSAHRRSILELIEQFERQRETKIRWVTAWEMSSYP